jgi:hypothetical protein
LLDPRTDSDVQKRQLQSWDSFWGAGSGSASGFPTRRKEGLAECGTAALLRCGWARTRSFASRVVSLQFISSEQSLAVTEMDSILDEQLLEERDEDATTSFGMIWRQVVRESQRPQFTLVHRRQESVPLHKRQWSTSSLQQEASCLGEVDLRTLLVDTSFDQLKPKSAGIVEMSDRTFAGPLFIEAGPSTSEVRKRNFLDAKSMLGALS